VKNKNNGKMIFDAIEKKNRNVINLWWRCTNVLNYIQYTLNDKLEKMHER